jgi:glycosyltransferase involved in cell wall biosynthesis
MKVIMAQSNLTLKGGAERVVLKIAQHYKARIYTAEYNKETTFSEFSDMDVQVVGRGRMQRLMPYGRVAQGLSYGLGFYGLKLDDDYDVINAHIAPSHWIRNRNERVLWYCHTPLRDVYDLYKYRLRMKKIYQKPVYVLGAAAVRSIDGRIAKRLEMIVANSENVRSRIAKYLGRDDAKVLGGGVEYERYDDKGDGKYFLYPSRMSPNKRQDYAIRAFELFKRRLKGYKLVLIGPVSKDGFYYDFYRKVLEMSKRVGDVDIVEDVSEGALRDYYARATAVLYTPIDEDYGLVPLEAMASYKPIISVNEGGPRTTVHDGETGFLVNSEDEMANRMAEVAENPALAERIGKTGRRYVEKEYSWDRFFREFDRYLTSVSRM